MLVQSWDNATDWKAVQRTDGSIFLQCGSAERGRYHAVFNISTDSIAVAERLAAAMNYYNSRTEACITPDHKVLTGNRGWVRADELTARDIPWWVK